MNKKGITGWTDIIILLLLVVTIAAFMILLKTRSAEFENAKVETISNHFFLPYLLSVRIDKDLDFDGVPDAERVLDLVRMAGGDEEAELQLRNFLKTVVNRLLGEGIVSTLKVRYPNGKEVEVEGVLEGKYKTNREESYEERVPLKEGFANLEFIIYGTYDKIEFIKSQRYLQPK